MASAGSKVLACSMASAYSWHGLHAAKTATFLTLFRLERQKIMKKKAGRVTSGSSAKGKTNWARLAAMPDRDIKFTKDAPRTSPTNWANAVAHRGLPIPSRKAQIALRVDEDVLTWFREQGAGYQTRMNAVLKAFRDAHKS